MSTVLGRGASDADLARAAIDGDDDAFAVLFERHLGQVFEAAWDVVRDRWVAADVTSEVFAAAWLWLRHLPVDDVAGALVAESQRRARARAQQAAEGGEGAAPTEVIEPDAAADLATAPGMGPVLHSRIVSTLQARGVPTAVDERPPQHAAQAAPTTGRPLHLGVAAAVLLVVGLGIGVVGIGMAGGGDDGTGAGEGEEAASSSDAGDRGRGEDGDESSSTTVAETTSSTEPTTTTTEATTTSTTVADTAGQTATTSAPPDTPPPSTAPPTTAPPAPVINTFIGQPTSRTCSNGQPEVALGWDSDYGESARLRARGGGSADVDVDGATLACAASGTEWTLTVTNAAGTDTAVITT